MENNDYKIQKKGYRIIFLLTLALSIMLECMIFMYYQVRKVDKMLRKDFKVILIKDKQSNPQNLIEEISKIKGVRNIEYIKAEESLDKINSMDKELYYSISSLGNNVVPDVFEVEVSDELLGDMDSFVDSVFKINGINDVKYKMLEAYAILHFSFYSNFLSMIISFVFLIIILLFFMGIIHVGILNFFSSIKNNIKWFMTGILGWFSGTLFIYAVIYPVKFLSPILEWPNAMWHILVAISCGLIAWVLYQWKKS